MPKYEALKAWSYSVYAQYIKCPMSVCFEKILRVRIMEPYNPHFEKGNRIHSAADVYISSIGKKPSLLAPELAVIKPRLEALRKAKARTEQEWAFTSSWTPTGWFDKDCWLRIKTDVCADTTQPPTVDIIDWKSGRPYDDHKQQRSLYALGGLQLVQIGQLAGGSADVKLTASHVYTDTGQTATEQFGMSSLAPLKREWLARIKQMMKDTKYPARTGRHCQYCKFAKSKGGPCQENQ